MALGWAGSQLDTWRVRGELVLARHEIARGRLEAARRRLVALTARPGVLGGAADYWLGICEALDDRPEAALRAFARLPEGYAFDPVGAYHEAKAAGAESSIPKIGLMLNKVNMKNAAKAAPMRNSP